jgi:hypothetical protein
LEEEDNDVQGFAATSTFDPRKRGDFLRYSDAFSIESEEAEEGILTCLAALG